jgi:Zn-dependent protease
MAFFFVMILWLHFLALHEYAHARVAYAGGDTTVADKGYLTLNPFRFASFTLSVVFPLLIFAIGGIPLPGGCVYIDKTRLRSRAWEALVAGAGIAAEVALLPVLLLPYWFLEVDPNALFWAVYSFFIAVLIFSLILNLLPVPPLDGYGMIEPFLPRRVTDVLDTIKPAGFWIVFIIAMGFSRELWYVTALLTSLVGVDVGLAFKGYEVVFSFRV